VSLPQQPGVYRDCYEIWSRAQSTPGGCRTFVGTSMAQAEYLRSRMHQARKLLRNQSKRAYPREHPAWDTSEYDSYKITIKQDTADNFWLYVEPHGNWAAVANIEPIPAEEQLIQPPAIPDMTQLRLPAPVNDSDTELE
jgi:hypothetical protein